MNTLMTIVAVFIVDKIGRRRLLLGGMCLASISLSLAGLIFYFDMHTPLMVWATFSFLMLYIAGYCLSIGSLFWLIISEIYPLNIRSVAMSFVTAMQWGASFVVTLTFLSIVDAIGMAFTFWIYAFVCLLTFMFCHYLVPETTGVTLEEIENNLRQGKPVRELGRVANF
jgi:MFS family permease